MFNEATMSSSPTFCFNIFACEKMFFLSTLKTVMLLVSSDGITHAVIYKIASSRPQKPSLNCALEIHSTAKLQNSDF